MVLISDIIREIERIAPLAIQEEWDNCGVQVGATDRPCTGAMLCVDCTEEIISQAIEAGCNLVVSHHPLIFGGLKRLTGATAVERTVMRAIASGVTVYSSHTALDNSPEGVSREMARMLGLKDVAVLAPRTADMLKLTVFVPDSHLDAVREAIARCGAGHIGDYDCCSFAAPGKGTFRALDGAQPWVGSVGEIHTEPEHRLEMVVPRWLKGAATAALRKAHPYEEPAFEFAEVETGTVYAGLGCVGTLPEPMPAPEFAAKAAATFGCGGPRCSLMATDSAVEVTRVALCGGAGGSLIRAAIGSGAQAYVSADIRYHDYVDHGRRIGLIDVGHFNSEHCAETIFYRLISEKFPNFAVCYATDEKNPIQYL